MALATPTRSSSTSERTTEKTDLSTTARIARNPWAVLAELPEESREPFVSVLRAEMAREDRAGRVVDALLGRLRADLAADEILADRVARVESLLIVASAHRRAIVSLAADVGRQAVNR